MTTPNRWPYTVRTPLDPDASLDYAINWSDWLEEGESVVAAVWTVEGATSSNEAIIGSRTRLFLSAPTGALITAACQITTNSTPPRTDERTLIIPVAER